MMLDDGLQHHIVHGHTPSGINLRPNLDYVLVVEDEYFIADDMERALIAFGCEADIVADPPSALRALQQRRPDAAVLDLNLRGEMTFVVADALLERGIPFLFMTGHEPHVIPRRFNRIVRCEKPVAPRQVVSALFYTLRRHARTSDQKSA